MNGKFHAPPPCESVSVAAITTTKFNWTNLTLPNRQMEICSLLPNLAGASQANGDTFRLLRTLERGCYLGFRGVDSGVKGLTSPMGLAL